MIAAPSTIETDLAGSGRATDAALPAAAMTLSGAREPAITRLRVLSGFDLRISGRSVVVPSNVERILAYLAVRGRPQPRATVAATLWMDTTDDRANANLRTALWKARQAVGECIVVCGNALSLAPEVDVDLGRIVARSHRLLDAAADLHPEDHDPGDLVGDLLPDWDEEWILFERERLRQLRIHALEALCHKLSMSGHGGRAVDVGLAAVSAEPLRESAQRVLIEAHLREGNVSEARRQYHLYRALLRDNLAIEPSEGLRDLVGLAATSH